MSERITDDEQAYLDACRRDLTQAQAIAQHYGAHLARKHGLGQGDAIKPDGTIQRSGLVHSDDAGGSD